MDEVLRNIVIQFATTQLGVPYMYRANGAGAYDCSSFINESHKTVGLLPYGDRSAQDIYNYYSVRFPATPLQPRPGSLLFYGENTQKITHVAMVYSNINGTIFIIECGGGDSTTTTIEEARRRGAMVRIRPLHSRTDFVALIDPFQGV